MDRNVLLATVLSMAVLFAYMSWQSSISAEHAKAQQAAEELAAADAAAEGETLPEFDSAGEERPAAAEEAAAPEVAPPAAGEPAAPVATAAPPAASVAPWTGQLENDDVVATLTNAGGGLIGWRMKGFMERTPLGEIPVEFVDPTYPALLTSLVGLGLGDLRNACYEVVSQTPRSVEMVLRRGDIEVRRTFSLAETGYDFSLKLALENTGSSATPISLPALELVWPAAANHRPDFRELALTVLSEDKVKRDLVPSVGRPGFFSRIFGGGDKGPKTFAEGVQWAGVDLRYFVGVLFDGADGEFSVRFEPIEMGKVAETVFDFGPMQLGSKASVVHALDGFIGPKKTTILEAAGRNLELSVNRGYSWFVPLTRLFDVALQWLYVVTHNYGIAIILLTIIVRLGMAPVMVKQMKSMERMREVQPKLKELQEKYKDDRQKQSEEMMRLYREEGVNPLGGCFPMLLQFPVFIGLFYALQSSFALRHAPFMLWINDLSVPATLFMLPGLDFPVRLLPLIMGASMFAQQKMTPTTGMDPAQQKMMMVMMPGMMLFISYTFPSGLVLYWTVSNLLGIGHQLWVRRNMKSAAS